MLASIVPNVYKGFNGGRGDDSHDLFGRRCQCANEVLAADFYRSPLSRRQVLQVGALGTLGLSLPAALRAEAQSGLKVRAKSVIFLHQFGGPAHQDTFDMKPDAPAEIRGEFKPIPSSLPGINVCELLPRLSRVMHHFTVVRSVSHRIGAAQLGGLLLADGSHSRRSTSSPPRPRLRTFPPTARSSASSPRHGAGCPRSSRCPG